MQNTMKKEKILRITNKSSGSVTTASTLTGLAGRGGGDGGHASYTSGACLLIFYGQGFLGG